MGKNQSASNLVNIIQYNNGNISFVSGSTTLMQISSSGAITTTGVISGSNALSASYAATASFVTLAQTASFVTTAQTASFVANAQTASFVTTAQTASFVANAQSASNAVAAQTASFANTFTVAGTLTAQTLVVQTVTSSVDFVTGSTRFGSLLSNTHIFSGSVTMNPNGLFISSSGFVGISTTNPQTPLQILKDTNTNGTSVEEANMAFTVLSAAGQSKIAIGACNAGNYGYVQVMQDATSWTNRALVLQPRGGNVGIGVTSPRVPLDLGSANNRGQVIVLGETGTNNRVGFGLDSGTAGMRIFTVNNSSQFIDLGGISTTDGTTWTRNHRFGIAGGNTWLNEQGGSVGIGTTSPSRKLHIRSTDDTRGLLIDQTSTTSYSEVHFLASREYRIGTGGSSSASEAANNWYVYDATAALQRFVINSSGNVGIGTTSPAARLHNRGSFITENSNGRHYGEAKTFIFQSAFSNPTISLITINSTSSYGAIMIRVTVYQNTVSTSRSNIHVGYANWAADPYPTVNKGIIAPTVIAQFNGCTNVGTLAWSGNTLQYTANRHTNYDGYTIVVEWGANTDHNAAPTYGGELQ